MKFVQIIEYNMRKIFLEKKHTQNLMQKLSPEPFLKKPKIEHVWINGIKFCTVCFYCMPS